MARSEFLLIHFIRALLRETGRAVFLAIGLMVVCTLTESLGILLLLPALQTAGFNLGGHENVSRLAQLANGLLSRTGLHPTLGVMLLIYVALIGVRGVFGAWRWVKISELQQRFATAERLSLYRAILNARWSFLCTRRSAELSHALTQECDRTSLAVQDLLTLCSSSLVTLVYTCGAFAISPATSLLIVACAASLAVITRGRTRAINRSAEDLVGSIGRLYTAATEQVSNLKTAKFYGAHELNLAAFGQNARDVAETMTTVARHQAWLSFGFDVGAAALLAPTVYLAIEVMAVSPGDLMLLLLLFARVMPQAAGLSRLYHNILNYLPSFARVEALRAQCSAEMEPTAQPNGAVPCLARELRLNAVTFSYPGSQTPVLEQINLVIPSGTSLAIVGESGAGKSTLADIIMGLLVPSQGSVAVDGIALEGGLLRAWRDRVGYVGPDTFLFNGTVRENLGWVNADADGDSLWEALRIAAADEFVRAAPKGLDTPVGDRGILFSQGERQRLALARALLHEPSLLVIDEAFSAVDTATEKIIWDRLMAMRPRPTLVVIAHRPSTVQRADFVYVLENRKLRASGSFDSLWARSA